MWKKIGRGMEKWGHYLLALLCAGVVLLSAVWTREQQAGEQNGRAALSDQSQRLAQAALETPPPALRRPAEGRMALSYQSGPVFFPQTGVWQSHPALDFEAAPGDEIRAMAEGVVLSCGEEITVDHGALGVGVYRGAMESLVRPGQRVGAGALLGLAGARVPFEGEGHVCVRLLQDGEPAEFGKEWVDNSLK